MKENADKHRALDTAELQKNFRESAEQMFRLKFQMSMGQMEGLKKYRSLKRDRARMLTVLRERERLIRDNGSGLRKIPGSPRAVLLLVLHHRQHRVRRGILRVYCQNAFEQWNSPFVTLLIFDFGSAFEGGQRLRVQL